jgi:hypothetical protein
MYKKGQDIFTPNFTCVEEERNVTIEFYFAKCFLTKYPTNQLNQKS